MTLRNSPLAIAALTYTPEPFREAFASLAGSAGGAVQHGANANYYPSGYTSTPVLQGDFATQQRGAGANMSVDVTAGGAWVVGSSNATNQGSYFMRNDATINVAVTASSGSQTREDIVALTVNDATYAGGTNSGVLAVVAGTFGGGLPSLPASSLALAHVHVRVSATTVLTTDITDLRVFISGMTSNPAGRFYTLSGSSIPNGGTLGIGNGHLDFLRGGMGYGGDSGPTLIVPVTGWYAFNATIIWPVCTGALATFMYVAAAAVRSFYSTSAGVGDADSGGTDILPLNAGDAVQLVGAQVTGGTLVTVTGSSGWNGTSLSGSLVSLP